MPAPITRHFGHRRISLTFLFSFTPPPPALHIFSFISHLPVSLSLISLFIHCSSSPFISPQITSFFPRLTFSSTPTSFSLSLKIVFFALLYQLKFNHLSHYLRMSLFPYALSFCYDSGFLPSVLSSAWMWMRYQSPHLPDRLENDIIFLLRSQSEASTWSPAFGDALCTQERRQREKPREGHRDTKTDRQRMLGGGRDGG